MPIRLHKFGEAWGIADPSPFCVKLESFLREADIAYEAVPFEGRRSFAKAPKGKLPFIEDEDGTIVGDSTLIIGGCPGGAASTWMRLSTIGRDASRLLSGSILAAPRTGYAHLLR